MTTPVRGAAGSNTGALRSVYAVLAVAVQSAGNTAALGLVAVVTARELGAEDRGIIVITVATATLAMLLASAGANYAGRVLLVASPPMPLPAFHGVGLGLCAAAAPLGGAAAWLAYRLSGIDVSPWAVAALGTYTSLLLAVYLQREVLAAHGATAASAAVELTGAVFQLSLVLLLVYGFGVDSAGPVLAVVVVAPLAQMAVATLAWQRHGLPLRPAWSRGAAHSVLRLGRKGVSIGLAQSLAQRFDRLVLGAVVSAASVGVYSVAVTITEVLWFVPMALGQVLSVRVARRAVTLTEVRLLRLANVALAGLAAVVLGLVAPALIDVAFGPEFAGAVQPLRILLLASVLAASYHVDVLCLNATGRTGTAAVAAVTGGLTTVVLNLVIIPRHEMVGAAWCSVAGYGVMAALTAFWLGRALRTPPALHSPEQASC